MLQDINLEIKRDDTDQHNKPKRKTRSEIDSESDSESEGDIMPKEVWESFANCIVFEDDKPKLYNGKLVACHKGEGQAWYHDCFNEDAWN